MMAKMVTAMFHSRHAHRSRFADHIGTEDKINDMSIIPRPGQPKNQGKGQGKRKYESIQEMGPDSSNQKGSFGENELLEHIIESEELLKQMVERISCMKCCRQWRRLMSACS